LKKRYFLGYDIMMTRAMRMRMTGDVKELLEADESVRLWECVRAWKRKDVLVSVTNLRPRGLVHRQTDRLIGWLIGSDES
jgi:hypothetical protein